MCITTFFLVCSHRSYFYCIFKETTTPRCIVKRILEESYCPICINKLSSTFSHFPELDPYSVRPLKTEHALDGILHS